MRARGIRPLPRLLRLLPILLFAAAIPSAAGAQLPGGLSLSLEVAPRAALAVGQFAERAPGFGARTGVGAGAGVLVRGSRLGVYGGYGYMRFACGGCEEGGLDELADLGWEGGVQLDAPLRLVGVRPWLRGGVLAHQLRVTGNGTGKTSAMAAGIAIGAGTDLPLGPLVLAPTVRFSTYPADFEFSTVPARSTPVTYLGAGVGLVYRF